MNGVKKKKKKKITNKKEKSALVSLMRYAHVRPAYGHIPAVTRTSINNPSRLYVTKIVAIYIYVYIFYIYMYIMRISYYYFIA